MKTRRENGLVGGMALLFLLLLLLCALAREKAQEALDFSLGYTLLYRFGCWPALHWSKGALAAAALTRLRILNQFTVKKWKKWSLLGASGVLTAVLMLTWPLHQLTDGRGIWWYDAFAVPVYSASWMFALGSLFLFSVMNLHGAKDEAGSGQ